jgi:hypothetical protein
VHPREVVDQNAKPAHRLGVHARLTELDGGLQPNLQGILSSAFSLPTAEMPAPNTNVKITARGLVVPIAAQSERRSACYSQP